MAPLDNKQLSGTEPGTLRSCYGHLPKTLFEQWLRAIAPISSSQALVAREIEMWRRTRTIAILGAAIAHTEYVYRLPLASVSRFTLLFQHALDFADGEKILDGFLCGLRLHSQAVCSEIISTACGLLQETRGEGQRNLRRSRSADFASKPRRKGHGSLANLGTAGHGHAFPLDKMLALDIDDDDDDEFIPTVYKASKELLTLGKSRERHQRASSRILSRFECSIRGKIESLFAASFPLHVCGNNVPTSHGFTLTADFAPLLLLDFQGKTQELLFETVMKLLETREPRVVFHYMVAEKIRLRSLAQKQEKRKPIRGGAEDFGRYFDLCESGIDDFCKSVGTITSSLLARYRGYQQCLGGNRTLLAELIAATKACFDQCRTQAKSSALKIGLASKERECGLRDALASIIVDLQTSRDEADCQKIMGVADGLLMELLDCTLAAQSLPTICAVSCIVKP